MWKIFELASIDDDRGVFVHTATDKKAAVDWIDVIHETEPARLFRLERVYQGVIVIAVAAPA